MPDSSDHSLYLMKLEGNKLLCKRAIIFCNALEPNVSHTERRTQQLKETKLTVQQHTSVRDT